ncbi:ribonuclease activity regulator RraA [Microvirga zambiensis]|uniref:RraA family protein n=1 Tax=Microvirga zambiensis TaxID=1402137 RepID=UPI00191D6029|nr:ribonuclease activity regulator RraA [Microvirga zambiensis]
MIQTPDIKRPDRHLVEALREIGTATISSELRNLGIRNAAITGPRSFTPGRIAAGPALTLQFMPMREDQFGSAEYDDPEKQLHRHVLYHAQKGDVVVVDARGDMDSGIFGEMMLTYFVGLGGEGVVIDGCIRDSAKARDLGVGLWIRGVTPNFHAQTNIFPFAVNVPIACANTFVVPGDIIVADNDGAVVVPISLAEQVIEVGSRHAEWEEFSRLRLSQGGDLRKYYPLRADAEAEYLAWKAPGGS